MDFIRLELQFTGAVLLVGDEDCPQEIREEARVLAREVLLGLQGLAHEEALPLLSRESASEVLSRCFELLEEELGGFPRAHQEIGLLPQALVN